jgi:hypothetical protein
VKHAGFVGDVSGNKILLEYFKRTRYVGDRSSGVGRFRGAWGE